MEQSEREILQKEAWQEGYDAALAQVRNAIRLCEMGVPDCEIVKRTDLPPTIIHGLKGI